MSNVGLARLADNKWVKQYSGLLCILNIETHPYRHECMRDLRLVFRDPSDQGYVRTKETPSPDIL